MSDAVTLALVVVGYGCMFVSGWSLSWLRSSPGHRHERAIEQFAVAQDLDVGTPTADLSDVIIAFDGIRLRHAGTDRSGVEVYVNAEPFPHVNAIAVENLPSQSAIVIIGDQL
jgi:hypothetical protein